MAGGTSQNTGHYDEVLTNMAVAWMQSPNGFVADKVFPIAPVQHASAVYPVYPRGSFFRDEVDVRPMGGRAKRIDVDVTWQTYLIEEESLEAAIDRRETANETSPIDIEAAKMRAIMAQHMIHRDRKWAARYFTTGIWGSDVTGVASAPSASQELFWNLDTAEPGKIVRARKRAMKMAVGYEPNILVLGSDVELALADHPAILERITGGATVDNPAEITNADLERYFGLRVVTGTAIHNVAPEGGTEDMDAIVNPKSALLAYTAPGVSTMGEQTAGVTFAWTGLLGGNAAGVAVERWWEDPAKSWIIEGHTAHDPRIVSPELGIFFSAIVQ